MSNATASHPAPEVLTAYGLGKLPDPETEVIARHLTTCAECRRLVEGVAADSLVGLVRSTKQATVLPAADPAYVPAGPGQSQLGGPAEAPPPPADLPPELADHPKYKVLRVLGQGGMGVVYAAEHRQMHRQVALKVISQSLVDRPEAVERFLREVRAAAKLSHPNIVTAYDAEQAGGLQLLVMEYVQGTSLAQVVEKKGPLPIAYACNFIRQAALGLQHASEQGMVHRDLKPHNLMVTPKGQVKILDFGLARLAAEKKVGPGLTAEDAVMGTPEYLAPEQALDARQADVRADIYSLGCTLYCLLAGQPPFPEGTAMQKIMAHLERQARPLPEVRADVPAALWAVIERMLAREPGQRYQQPVEVAQALVPFIKAGAKAAAGGTAAAPARAASPGSGTLLGGDTSKVLNLPKDAGAKPSVKELPAQAAPADPFANPTEAVAGPKSVRAAVKPKPAAWYRRPPVLFGVAAAALLLGFGAWLLSGVVFQVKTKDGLLIVAVNEPNPDVFVDGGKVTLTWDKAGKQATIRIKPGTYQVEVKKDGFTAHGEQVTLEEGGHQVLTARLEKLAPRRPAPLDCNGPLGFSAEEVRQAQAAWALYLGRQVEEEDEIAPGVKMAFVLVPPGRFWMGSPEGENGRRQDETLHEVTITQPFYLGKYVVTQVQYQAVTRKNPSYFKGAELPVEQVSWEEADAFARELSGKREWKHSYRLPTEAEWEYACRGGRPSSQPFGIGDGRSLSSTQANFNGKSPYGGADKGPRLGKTTPVGKYAANALGLYEMHGNVWEWCADCYGDYPSGKATDPTGPSTGSGRVLRCGGWGRPGFECRAAHRCGVRGPAFRAYDIGFRLARVPSGMGK